MRSLFLGTTPNLVSVSDPCSKLWPNAAPQVVRSACLPSTTKKHVLPVQTDLSTRAAPHPADTAWHPRLAVLLLTLREQMDAAAARLLLLNAY